MYGTLHALRKKTLAGKSWCQGVAVALDDGLFFLKDGAATELRSAPMPQPASPSSPSDIQNISFSAESVHIPTYVFINTRFGDDRFGSGSLTSPVRTRAAALKLSIVADAPGVVVAFEFDGSYDQVCDWKSVQCHIWPHPPKNDRGNVFVLTRSSTTLAPFTSHYFSADTPTLCNEWIAKLVAFATKDSELTQLRAKFISAAEALDACGHQEVILRQHIDGLMQQNRELCVQMEGQQRLLQVHADNLQRIHNANILKEQEREEALVQMAAAALDRKNAAAEAKAERELRERLEQERTHEIVRAPCNCTRECKRHTVAQVRSMGFGRCSADIKKAGSPLGQKVLRATAALSKNLFDHVGAISNRSISPAYKQVDVALRCCISLAFLFFGNCFVNLICFATAR